MEISPDEALRVTALLIGLAIALQSIEFLQLRKDYDPWKILRRDYLFLPPFLLRLFDFCLCDRHFFYFNVARLIAALLLMVFPGFLLSLFLLLATVLICLRYRGSFNGGSDFMTLIVLMAMTIGTAFPAHPLVTFGALWYIAIQSSSSYFVGGFIKLKRANWRNGSALFGFLGSSIYQETALIRWMRKRKGLTFLAAWTAMLFEVCFPILVFAPQFTLVALVTGLIFHQLNAYLFGLNRFFFAWAATYPALFYCSQSLQLSFN